MGRALIEKLIEEVKTRESGVTGLYLHARHYAIGFYKKLGFVEKGERFIEINMEHCEMELNF